MGQNNTYTKEYLRILNELQGDIKGRMAAQSYMDYSNAVVRGAHVPHSYIPRFFGQETYNTFKHVAETTYSITVKIMQRYFDDPSYRSLFDYDDRLVDLILTPRGYPDILPFARIDVFLDENTYSCGFCEINSDGSSGLNEDKEQGNAFAGSSAMHRFAEDHSLANNELFGSWSDEFLSIYGRFENRVTCPNIAVIDFLGPKAITAEFEEFCRQFSKRGYPSFVADVRELRYDGKTLRTSEGRRIDAAFRRCVTSDILDNWEESQPLIQAVKDGNVALIGSFAGHIPHDKQIFEAMRHPITQEFLTDEEKQLIEACVPRTYYLNPSSLDIEDVKRNKDSWIIKPSDRYGAANVFAGTALDEDEWCKTIDRLITNSENELFLIQEYITPFKTEFLRPDSDLVSKDVNAIDTHTVPMNNMSGLYLFNGTFAGVFNRMGEDPVIGGPGNSRYSAATIWVDCNVEGTMRTLRYG